MSNFQKYKCENKISPSNFIFFFYFKKKRVLCCDVLSVFPPKRSFVVQSRPVRFKQIELGDGNLN